MSVSQVPYPIVSALVKAEAILGSERCWVPRSPQQEAFLMEVFLEVRGEVGDIRGLMSDYSLTGNELTIRGVLDLLVNWLHEGSITTIERNGQRYEGVRLSVKDADVSFLKSDTHPHPIVRVPTQSDDVVYMTVLGDQPDPLGLTAQALSLLRKPWEVGGYDAVRFPMIDLKHDNDVDWIVGMETSTADGVPAQIGQASQETKLRVNQKGAHVRSEFQGTVLIASSLERMLPDLVIDQPFLLFFTREGLEQPLAVLYITEKDWSNPGTLDL